MKKHEEFAAKITAQINEMFNEDCENYIDPNELIEGNNGTEFMHALANLAPAMIIRELTGKEYDLLGFNHLANRIAAQNINFIDK
jgi:hypothetical protein